MSPSAYIIEQDDIPALRAEFPEADRFWDHVSRQVAQPCGCNACSSGQFVSGDAGYRSPYCEAGQQR